MAVPRRWGTQLRRVPLRYWGALVLYLGLGAVFIHDWDGFVFERATRDFWDGQSPYSVAEEAPYYTWQGIQDSYGVQWYAYPPLPLLTMSVTFSPELFLDVPPPVERLLLKLPMIVGTLALAAVGGAWARHLGKDEATTRRVERLLLFNPFLILVGPVWGMTDPALMALLLGGLLRFDQGRSRESGVLLGLSLLVKPFTVLFALPLLAYYVHNRGWQPVGRAFAAGSAVTAAVCLPFVLASPSAFWNQVILVHLQRGTQGLTIWLIGPLADLDPNVVRGLSLVMLTAALLLLSLLAPRLQGGAAPLALLFATAVQILLWNRVVNEQYFALVVAPLVLLFGLRVFAGRLDAWAAHGAPILFSGITIILGYHFLTLFPPDVSMALFGTSVDVMAFRVGQQFNWGWESPFSPYTVHLIVGIALALLALLSLRYTLRTFRPGPTFRGWTVLRAHRNHRASAASGFGCALLFFLGLLPIASPVGTDASPFETDVKPAAEPLVGAFYYLWWYNAGHDPATQYGNWMEVSQSPELGYYTNTRGLARTHVEMMRENGIDVAVVSYHSPEIERYHVFQEEAARQGLLVAPLIELNQIYDRIENKPVNETGMPVRHAQYRATPETRQAIVDFVLDLQDVLRLPNTYRVDGRPVIYFYDSYVSGVGFSPGERAALAEALISIKSLSELRYVFNDPRLDLTVESVLEHYPIQDKNDPAFQDILQPPDMIAFYQPYSRGQTPHADGVHRLNQSAVWREAHLALHQRFWADVRADLEAALGPLFLVSGDAFNEGAGFESGIVKSLEGLAVFDGSFIYSPSFTWGVQPRNGAGELLPSFDQNFRLWEDRNLWLTAFAQGMGKYSAFGIAPGYDDTVKRPEIGFRIPYEHNGTYTYDRSWDSALENPPSFVVLATFNEFFEGSSVEPDTTYGSLFLEHTLAHRARFQAAAPATGPVVALVHERLSRTHPLFAEMDDPHEWGLKLISAASRNYPGAVVAVDGLAARTPALAEQPALLLIDGGRDAYDVNALSPDVVRQLERWVRDGVPTIIFGREVASSLRLLLPPACAVNPWINLGHSVFPDDYTLSDGNLTWLDNARSGDRFEGPATAEEAGHVFLRRDGVRYTAGHRCEQAPNVAFFNIKPWGPVASQDLGRGRSEEYEATVPTDEACLGVLVAAFHPAQAPLAPASCQIR